MTAIAQSLPKDRLFTLISGDKWSPQLVYADIETGEELAVPSIWYNQPPAWRADYLRFCAEQRRAAARTLRALPFPKPWEITQAKENDKVASELDLKAEAMAFRCALIHQQPGQLPRDPG